MVESATLLGWLAAAVLFAAVAAWLKLGRGPLLRRLNGSTQVDPGQTEKASRLLALACGLCAVAAAVALGGLMFG